MSEVSARWLPEEFWEFASQYPNDSFEEVYNKYLNQGNTPADQPGNGPTGD